MVTRLILELETEIEEMDEVSNEHLDSRQWFSLVPEG